MSDALESVLRMVAEGRMTADEAAPLIAALQDRGSGPTEGAQAAGDEPASPARQVRVEIRERGRSIVNVRVPVALGQAAIGYVPGLSAADADRVREALALGLTGEILQVVGEDGDESVRIVLE